MGHIIGNYFKLKNKLKQKGKPSEKNTETAETHVITNESDENIFFVIDNRTRSKNKWILGLECSYHMYPNRNLFSTY